MQREEFKPGDLVFLKTDMADLLYVVKGVEGKDVLVARKLDAPPKQIERLATKNCVKLSEGQEKLLPDFLLQVVRKQRQENFPKREKEKKMSLEEALKELPEEKLDEVFELFRGCR